MTATGLTTALSGTISGTAISGTAAAELIALVPSWELHLRAERKADGTVKTYLDGVCRSWPGAPPATSTRSTAPA